jgi:hypothetical protein
MNKILLQSGNFLSAEKTAFLRSDYDCRWITYSQLTDKLNRNDVPMGTIEFVERFSTILNINLPKDFSYGFDDCNLHKFLKRKIIRTTYSKAPNNSFIKPLKTKLFTGNIKSQLDLNFEPNLEVWSSEPVNFTVEYRIYIHLNIIIGYSRYDHFDCVSEEIDLDFIQKIINSFKNSPVAYSIDIGWNDDKNEWCLIELNDAWSLGFYNNSDESSNPPTNLHYCKMIVDRWNEILEDS